MEQKSFMQTSMSSLHPIICESIKDGGQFVFYPSGMSMYPTIKEKEDCVVLVEAENLQKNDLILYLRDNGKYVLHRIISLKNGKYILCGDNQVVYERGITDSNIIAMAHEIRKPSGKVISLDEIRAYTPTPWQFVIRQIFRIRSLLGRIKRKIFR